MKVSFRKGGVQGFYTILKRSLKSKAWEVRLFYSALMSPDTENIQSRATQLYKSSSGTPREGDGNATTRGGISTSPLLHTHNSDQ